jgi:hypothetical protein
VIEETLRARCPVEYLPLRYAVEDIELGDLTITGRTAKSIRCAAASPAESELFV